MAQTNGNSAMEMGTSDQVLVTSKRKKTLTFILGGIAMLVGIAVVVTLVVVLSGNQGGVASPIQAPTTEGPTTPVYVSTEATTVTTEATTTQAPVTEPSVEAELELQDVISGVYSTASFNGTWTSDSNVLYRNADGNLVLYDLTADSTTLLVQNTSALLQQSSRVTQLSPDGNQVVLAYGVVPVYRYSFLARYTAVNVVTGDEVDIVPPGVEAAQAFLQNFVWGPAGTACAFVYLNNIYYKATLASEAVQVTTTGQLNVIYHGIPDWVYEEEVFGTNNALWFSGDGGKMAYASFDDTNVRVMRVPHYGVPGSVNYQYTQHHEIRYPKPGTTNPTVSVTLRDISSGASAVYQAPSTLEQPILKTVKFVTNSTIALVWTNRVQTDLIVQLCEETSTNCSQIYSYNEADGWIDNIPFIFNAAGNSFITILPQAVDSELYKQVVQVTNTGVDGAAWTAANRVNLNHTVADILLWTDDDVIWYKATSPQDSAEQHIYTASTSVACFTCAVRRTDGGECLYNDGSINSAGSLIIVNCAGPEVPEMLVYNSSGEFVRSWDTNEGLSSLLENRSLPLTLRMQVPVAEGYPDADVHIQVPRNYLSMTNVPLLVYVYAGPDTALVTKQWSLDWGTSLVSRWGVAVAHIDARGSGLRGARNMFAVNRRLGSVEIEDQINVTRYLQSSLPWLDANRTCIWGWSYGGYAASLALARGGDVFRCAIAVAPVTDWRFYDTIYTERYMDVPTNNTLGYADSSLLNPEVADAFSTKRFFLVHGTADDNVHYQHAMALSRLLQRRDVYFNQMSYTDEDHALAGVRPHTYHSFERFLRDNML